MTFEKDQKAYKKQTVRYQAGRADDTKPTAFLIYDPEQPCQEYMWEILRQALQKQSPHFHLMETYTYRCLHNTHREKRKAAIDLQEISLLASSCVDCID